jgi:hypothetical protein
MHGFAEMFEEAKSHITKQNNEIESLKEMVRKLLQQQQQEVKK